MESWRARDTSVPADRLQRSAFRNLGPIGRLQASFEMSEEMRQALVAGIRARHPEQGPAAVRQELLRLLYGDRLAAAIANR